MKKWTTLLLVMWVCGLLPLQAQKKKEAANESAKKEESALNAQLVSGMKFRSIGPAITSGRIADIAVNPHNFSEYYVATASGGVWKTENHGTTYKPVFDRQGSYSIGCVTIDPNDTDVVWVGSGENNSQRSVGYGDGVYKSIDGGKSWKNVGLKQSEHIGMIAVDPRNSDIVFVAAQGPLWSDGGDRGLYRTTDGGKTWENVLEIDEFTGVNEVHIDPSDPDVMYASAWQRARKVWTFLGGGPGSAIYKSTDGGKTWNKSQKGIPGGDLGKIGMDISPANPNVVYAIVEATGDKGGLFKSENKGASWKKMNSITTSSNYYQEIVCDPQDENKMFIMNTYPKYSEDGGKTVKNMGQRYMHVDHHTIWINPNDTRHMIMGNDGGLYESWDNMKNWHFKPNLPVTQFYKVAVDNEEPFYYVYGGTQDNYSLGGPSRTTNAAGVVNSDWFVTNGGDGFESAIDPENPNIVYAQSQYGGLIRFDKQSGEKILIRPMEGKDEPAYRWNWDAPLVISPHKSTRLYFAANKLFRSEDRGNTWTTISGDLSRQLDRNTFEIQDKIWSVDALAKNRSTSIYGNIVALDESPVQEDLLFAGTDDGLIHVTEDAGDNWVKMETFPGIPERTYVNMVLASQHNANTVYAAFNNHKNGDFKPYLLKSTDKGKTWTSIASNLPDRGSVYCIAEDFEQSNLLFVGTEFGVYFSVNGGEEWIQLKSGLPTVAVRDMAIQKRETDLVLATFGRGFYVLDNYAPLRQLSEEMLAQDAAIFDIKDARMFVQSRPLGRSGNGFQGASYFATRNPKVGAVFTYYVKESIKTAKQVRQAAEKKLAKDGKTIPYPSFEQMRKEDNEEKPYILFTITDEQGNIVNRLRAPATKGLKRMTWDLSYPSDNPVSVNKGQWQNRSGHMVAPGTYKVAMGKVEDGTYTEWVEGQAFTVKPLDNRTLPAANPQEVLTFQRKVSELARAVSSATALHRDMSKRADYIKAAVAATPSAPIEMLAEAREIQVRLQDMGIKLNGDRSVSRRNFETPPSINSRVGTVRYGLSQTTSSPTQTYLDAYKIASEEFEPLLADLKMVIKDIQKMEKKLEAYGAPYTPGRIPSWEKE
ncbi:MAG: glycosyl hydrolase [Bacteroidota bacterium]